MKNKIANYLIAGLFLFFASCEQENMIENNLPYEEFLVVRAQLVGEEVFEGVSFTKTIPHTQTYNINDAEVKNIIAYMQIDGKRIIPLSYTKEGIYKPLELFKIQSGKYYELFARWNDKQIYAHTYVPNEPEIKRAFIAGTYLNSEVLANKNEGLAATWIIAYNEYSITTEADDFFEIKISDFDIPVNTSVRTTDLPDQYRQLQYRDRYYIRIYAFDRQYKDYFETKSGNMAIENIFAQGASTIKWNVEGDKTIGLFIGFTKSKMVKVR